MDLKEALGLVANPEAKSFLEKMIENQNRYITQLEKTKNDLELQAKNQSASTSSNASDDYTKSYIEKNMIKDIKAEAFEIVKKTVSEEIFNAVKDDYDRFLTENMSVAKGNVKTDYAVRAFNLVLGNCMTTKDHPVIAILGKGSPQATPTQTTQQQDNTNNANVQKVQEILANQAPIMNGKDANSGNTPINSTGKKEIKNTRSAFDAFKHRLGNMGGNSFQ